MFLENQTLTEMIDVDFRIEFFHFQNCQHIFGPCITSKKSRWNSSASRITIFIPNIYKKWFSFFFSRAKQMFSAELFKNSISQVISISKCHTLNVQIQKKSYLWTKIDIITICTKPWAELLWYIRHNTFAYLTRVTQPFQHTYSSRLV